MTLRLSKNQAPDEKLSCKSPAADKDDALSAAGSEIFALGAASEDRARAAADVTTAPSEDRARAEDKDDALSAAGKNNAPASAGEDFMSAAAGEDSLLAAADARFMKEALKEAKKAAIEDEVPVGAVVVYQGKIIARGRNRREKTQCATRHAEMIAIERACKKIGYWRLYGCTLYVTLEPCPMCAGALWNARVSRLVYGAADKKAGACQSLYQIPTDERLNHRLQVTSGVMREDCAAVLSEFFRRKRALGKK